MRGVMGLITLVFFLVDQLIGAHESYNPCTVPSRAWSLEGKGDIWLGPKVFFNFLF